LLLLLVFFLTRTTETPPPQPPSRGAWQGNTFTSEYLGFTVTIPLNVPWRALSDAEIAALNRNIPDVETDFYIHHDQTAASIELTHKKIPQDAEEFSLREHLEGLAEIETEQANTLGLESSFEIIGNTILVEAEWLTKRSAFNLPGLPPVLVFRLVRQIDDFIVSIEFVVDDYDELRSIFDWFSTRGA